MAPKVKVVVLGAGHGGAATAKAIEKKMKNAEVTVVDKREAMIHKFGGLRALALGEKFSHRIVVPNQKLLKRGRVVHADIKNVTSNTVELEGQESLKFDYLVAATGARNKLGEPLMETTTMSGIADHYNSISKEIQAASKILIIGGGPVGVELAGEIAEFYPKKHVTIATSKDTLLWNNPQFPKKFHSKINAGLKRRNIKTVFSERCDIPFEENKSTLVGKRTVKFQDEEITVDLVINATGTVLNNSMYPDEWKNEKGQLAVRPTLQLTNFDNIFAVGDINDVAETKMGYLAALQANVCAANILKHSKKSASKLKSYSPSKPVMFVPLGKSGGAVTLAGLTLGGFAAGAAKGKSLFVSHSWSLFNVSSELKPEKK